MSSGKGKKLIYFLSLPTSLLDFVVAKEEMRNHAVCKFFNKKSVQIVEADSHISD